MPDYEVLKDFAPSPANMTDQTLTVIAECLGCKPDALSICEAIERLKRAAKKRKR